ncbi:MAG: hypothetical protein V2A71_02085 [Candidatus Eisenbacteria bacterium]
MRGYFLPATYLTLIACFLALPVSPAGAMVDAELSFEPDAVVAGNPFVASASITNLADVPAVVDLALSLSFWGWTVGPIRSRVTLGPYETHSGWQELRVPRCFPPGTLGVMIVAATGDGTDVETASLTILPPTPPCGRWRPDAEDVTWMEGAGSGILSLYQGSTTGVQEVNWGRVKDLFRTGGPAS